MRSRIGELAVQIVSVMIGVFLGLIVSNWSENKKERTKAKQLIENIDTEITTNKNRILQVINYHKMLRDSSQFYLERPEITIQKSGFFKGVNTLTLYNSAFDTGVQTGLINELPLDELQAINEVYTVQRSYEDFSNLLLGGMITLDFDESPKSTQRILSFLSVTMTDVVIKEEQLIESYNKALALIE